MIILEGFPLNLHQKNECKKYLCYVTLVNKIRGPVVNKNVVLKTCSTFPNATSNLISFHSPFNKMHVKIDVLCLQALTDSV